MCYTDGGTNSREIESLEIKLSVTNVIYGEIQ